MFSNFDIWRKRSKWVAERGTNALSQCNRPHPRNPKKFIKIPDLSGKIICQSHLKSLWTVQSQVALGAFSGIAPKHPGPAHLRCPDVQLRLSARSFQGANHYIVLPWVHPILGILDFFPGYRSQWKWRTLRTIPQLRIISQSFEHGTCVAALTPCVPIVLWSESPCLAAIIRAVRCQVAPCHTMFSLVFVLSLWLLCLSWLLFMYVIHVWLYIIVMLYHDLSKLTWSRGSHNMLLSHLVIWISRPSGQADSLFSPWTSIRLKSLVVKA